MSDFKIGDVLICLDYDYDEDFSASGLVFKGDRDIIKGDEYIIEQIMYDNIPSNERKTWTDEEYEFIKEYWTLCYMRNTRTKKLVRSHISDKFKKKCK